MFYQQAIQIREQALGSEHPLVAESLNELAVLFGRQERYEQAELLFQRALAIRQQRLGTKHPDVAETLYQLARSYQLQQQVTKAILLYQQALMIYEQALGPHHPKTNTTRITYIHFLRELGRVEEAVMVETQVRV